MARRVHLRKHGWSKLASQRRHRHRRIRLLLGVVRERQKTELEMLDGTDIVREVEAVGSRHAAAGAGPESEFRPDDEEVESLGYW